MDFGSEDKPLPDWKGSRPGGPGLVFVIEGAFVEHGGKEISLALVGKAHLVRMIIQSFVVMFKSVSSMSCSFN
jgi:hypothetical protein